MKYAGLSLENLLTSFQTLFKVLLMVLNEECSGFECGFSFVFWYLFGKKKKDDTKAAENQKL